MTTTLFWSIVLVMTGLALSFLLVPILRARSHGQVTRRDTNIALYRERVEELEQTLRTGGCSEEEAAALKAELDRRLVSDVETSSDTTLVSTSSRSRYVMAMITLVVLPVMAMGVYLYNSDWRLALAGNGPEAVQILLERLEQHLLQEPKDADAWLMLAQSRAQLQQYEAAAAAYSRLNALQPSAETLVAEAEALGMANAGNLQGRPALLVEQALRLDPDVARGLWYAGLVARQQGSDSKAVEVWNTLARQQLPDDFRTFLNSQIVQAGGKPAVAPVTLRIQVKVSVSPDLAKTVPATTPVFIYARDESGKGAPLAVIRRQYSELPLEVTIDDSTSMLPERRVSSVDRWVLTARVSLQGTAETRSGDLVTEQVINRDQIQKPIQLVIDRVVP